METRRKAEEAIRLRQEEEDRKAALALQAQLEKEAQEDSQYRQQLEQERRDHELALRLAQESNGQVEESPPVLRKYVFFSFRDFSFNCFGLLYIFDTNLIVILATHISFILLDFQTKFYPLCKYFCDECGAHSNVRLKKIFEHRFFLFYVDIFSFQSKKIINFPSKQTSVVQVKLQHWVIRID